MGQSRVDSLLESVLNSTVSVILYLVVGLGLAMVMTDEVGIVLIVIGISVLKNYIVRRIGVLRETK